MDRRRTAAILYAVMMVGVAAFQLVAVLGAPVASYTQGGMSSGSLSPAQRLVAAVSMVVVVLFAGVVAARAGLGPLRSASDRWLLPCAWVATVYGFAAVILNLVTRSAAERNVWAPYSAVALLLLLASRPTGNRVGVR